MLGDNPILFSPAIPLGLVGFITSGVIQATVETGIIPSEGAVSETVGLLAGWILIFAGILAYFDDFQRESFFFFAFGVVQLIVFFTMILSSFSISSKYVVPEVSSYVVGTFYLFVSFIFAAIPLSLWFTRNTNPNIRFERSLIGVLGLSVLILVTLYLIFLSVTYYVVGDGSVNTDSPAKAFYLVAGVIHFIFIFVALVLLFFQLARIISDKFIDIPLGEEPTEEEEAPEEEEEIVPIERVSRGIVWQEAQNAPIFPTQGTTEGSWSENRLRRATTIQQSVTALAGVFPYPTTAPRLEQVRRSSLPRSFMMRWQDSGTPTRRRNVASHSLPPVGSIGLPSDSPNFEQTSLDSGVPIPAMMSSDSSFETTSQ